MCKHVRLKYALESADSRTNNSLMSNSIIVLSLTQSDIRPSVFRYAAARHWPTSCSLPPDRSSCSEHTRRNKQHTRDHLSVLVWSIDKCECWAAAKWWICRWVHLKEHTHTRTVSIAPHCADHHIDRDNLVIFCTHTHMDTSKHIHLHRAAG